MDRNKLIIGALYIIGFFVVLSISQCSKEKSIRDALYSGGISEKTYNQVTGNMSKEEASKQISKKILGF